MSGSDWNPTDALQAEIDWTAGTLPGTTRRVDPQAAGVAGSAGLTLGTGTGQQGIVPLATNGGGGMIGDAVTEVKDWLNTPFTQSLSAVDIFLIVGIIIVAVVIWNLVLWHIRIAAETI